MLIQLAITGLLVALLPLTVVWAAADQNKFRKLIAVTVFLTFDLVMFGAFTRLTDSGLGCPDWPGCYGEANPFLAHQAISHAEILMPTGPVTVFKAWVEMIHRYLAMAVGVLIVAQLCLAVWRRHRLKTGSVTLPILLFAMVLVQGAFGAWTVTLKLQPVIVSTHLLLGMSLLAMLTWAWSQQRSQPATEAYGTLRRWAGLAWLILFIQLALGAWVSTNYSALACTDYPLCGGKLIPEMDFAHGFTLWRKLGQQANGDYLTFPALVAIHWVHRNAALIVCAVLGYTAWRARRFANLRELANGVLLVLTLQFCTGLANVFFSWPLLLAVMHNGGAALLMLLLTMLNYRVHRPAST